VNDPVDSSPAGSNVGAAPAPLFAAPAGAVGALVVPASAAVLTSAAPTMAAAPPAMAAPGAYPTRPAQQLALFPNNGQTPDQQARDRYGCYRFALAQAGYDPLHAKSGAPTAQSSDQEDAYDRVRTACLQGRGYTVH